MRKMTPRSTVLSWFTSFALFSLLLAPGAQATPSLSFLIDGDTFTAPFSITNDSTAGESVIGFRLDVDPAGLCFDLDSAGPSACNTSAGVVFTPSGGTDVTTGLIGGTVNPALTLLSITFSDFNAGESFIWDIDVDHVVGSSTVLGNEMIGSLAEIDFSNGETLLGVLAAVPGNLDAAEFSVTGVIETVVPEPSTASLLSLGLVGAAAMRRQRRAAEQRRHVGRSS